METLWTQESGTSDSKNEQQEVLCFLNFWRHLPHVLQYNMIRKNLKTIYNSKMFYKYQKNYIITFISIVNGKVY